MSRVLKHARPLSPIPLGIGLSAGMLLLFGALVHAQSGRSYSTAKPWWDAGRGVVFPMAEQYDDPAGELTVLNVEGVIRPGGHPFFEVLGANGRACITCHQPANAMSLSTSTVRQRWLETQGHDPVFASVDGANCPDLAPFDKKSHSLLLDRGLFRMTLPWPPKSADGAIVNPEFDIQVERDPTGCNTSPVYGLRSAKPTISVYRRPRMVANLKLAATPELLLMADGRETSLRAQAITAISTHEESTVLPSDRMVREIVAFENQLFAAQTADARGGLLNERNGPVGLGAENLALGRASLFSGLLTLNVSSFDVWRKPAGRPQGDIQEEFRASVARGSAIFSTRTFQMRNVLPFTRGASANQSSGTCASCHSGGPALAMDIGTTNLSTSDDSPDLPLFRITCASSSSHSLLGRTVLTHDPGRALVTGKCADVGSIVMQQLRGLSARAPYFANGSATTIRDVIDFYDRRFAIGYSEQEKQDLLNFLSVL
jgi:hypothetical protein